MIVTPVGGPSVPRSLTWVISFPPMPTTKVRTYLKYIVVVYDSHQPQELLFPYSNGHGLVLVPVFLQVLSIQTFILPCTWT